MTHSVDNIVGGDIPWLSSFAIIYEDQGTHIPSSTKSVHHIVTDISNSNTYDGSACQNKKLQCPLEQQHKHEPRTLLDALSFTSAFWTVTITIFSIWYAIRQLSTENKPNNRPRWRSS